MKHMDIEIIKTTTRDHNNLIKPGIKHKRWSLTQKRWSEIIGDILCANHVSILEFWTEQWIVVQTNIIELNNNNNNNNIHKEPWHIKRFTMYSYMTKRIES